MRGGGCTAAGGAGGTSWAPRQWPEPAMPGRHGPGVEQCSGPCRASCPQAGAADGPHAVPGGQQLLGPWRDACCKPPAPAPATSPGSGHQPLASRGQQGLQRGGLGLSWPNAGTSCPRSGVRRGRSPVAALVPWLYGCQGLEATPGTVTPPGEGQRQSSSCSPHFPSFY